MLDPVTNEIIYASNGCEEIAHEPNETTATRATTAANENISIDATNRQSSNIRRRKGKIISCAKETIEQGEREQMIDIFFYAFPSIFLHISK